MRGDNWEVQVKGVADGHVSRLSMGHAWNWKRSSGASEVFDCGMTISHVLGYMAVRVGCSPRDIDLTHPHT